VYSFHKPRVAIIPRLVARPWTYSTNHSISCSVDIASPMIDVIKNVGFFIVVSDTIAGKPPRVFEFFA
jgi:hypothetical protein